MSYADVTAVILAAGKGTRMRSDLAKVLHEAAGRPLLAHVLDACHATGIEHCVAVVGHQGKRVAAVAEADGAVCAVQAEQLGTGHAVLVAEQLVATPTVLVLCGDTPLLTADLLTRILDAHREQGNVCTAVAADLADPTGYGRMVVNESGRLREIIEHRDADPAQRAITLVNTGIFAFARAPLFRLLHELRPENVQGEYYLTDVPKLLAAAGERVGLVLADEPDTVRGVNTVEELAAAEAILRARS